MRCPRWEDIINNRVEPALITSGDIRPVDPIRSPSFPVRNLVAPPTVPLPVADLCVPDRYHGHHDSPVMNSTWWTHRWAVPRQPGRHLYDVGPQQDSGHYWRCSPDSTGNGGVNWYESPSRRSRPHGVGAEAHFFQFGVIWSDQVVFESTRQGVRLLHRSAVGPTTVQGNSSGQANDLTQWYIGPDLAGRGTVRSTPAFPCGRATTRHVHGVGQHVTMARTPTISSATNHQEPCRSRGGVIISVQQNDRPAWTGC